MAEYASRVWQLEVYYTLFFSAFFADSFDSLYNIVAIEEIKIISLGENHAMTHF